MVEKNGLRQGEAAPSAADEELLHLPPLPYAGEAVQVPETVVAELPPLPHIHLRGLLFHSLTEAQVVQHIIQQLAAGRGGWAITPNLDHLRRLVHDDELRDLYAGADLVVADGMPLVWASRLQGTPLPGRVAGSSLISTLSAAAAEHGYSVYLVGGAPGTAQNGAIALQARYPNLQIAGTYYPEMGFEKDPRQVGQLIEHLCRADPHIIYVGLGSPKQERLIGQIRRCLPGAWWLGVGVSFSFLSGHVRRAPAWMQKTGLEWLHRLMQEPQRLAKRYLVEGLPFAASLLTGAAVRRVSRMASHEEEKLPAKAGVGRG